MPRASSLPSLLLLALALAFASVLVPAPAAKTQAQVLHPSDLFEQVQRALAGLEKATVGADEESREDFDHDDHGGEDIDEATDLESSFGDSLFGIFGPVRQPWWKGPNVCVEREEIDESQNKNRTDDDEGTGIFGSFHFSSCQQTPVSYTCRTKMSSHGIWKTFVVKYQCCYGHQRVEGKPGCVEVHMKPVMETLEDIGVHEFLKLIHSAKLEEVIEDDNVTIFAPSNDAIRDFSDNHDEANQVDFYSAFSQRKKRDAEEGDLNAREIILSHVVPGFYDTNDIANKNELLTESNSTIRLNVYPGPKEPIITANCAPVKSVNNYANNGIVHIVERVLQPVTRSLTQLIDEDEQFTVLKSMLTKSGYLKQLAEPGHWTLFAFTDSAFQKLDANIQKRLMEADACIKNVVRHHLVPHILCSSPIMNHATTLNIDGEPLSLERSREDSSLFVNKVKIVIKDIVATNGVIHVLDEVMMPDSGQPLTHILQKHNLTTFQSLLEEAGLSDSLDATNNITLFVPSEKALADPQAIAELERCRSNQTALRDLLLFHSTGPAVLGCDLGLKHQQLKSGLDDHSLRLGYYSSWPFLSNAVPGRATVECAQITRFDGRACGGVVHEVNKLLIPPEYSMLDKLQKLGNYSIFLQLIEKANLGKELKENAPLTILAVPDPVFKQLDPDDLQLLYNDTELTTRIIRHHILPEMLCCSGIPASSWLFVNKIETIDGHYLTVRRDNNNNRIHIGSASVMQCDLMATDGVIHSVNRSRNPLRRSHLTAKLSFAPSIIDRAQDQQLEVLFYKLQHVEETSRRLQKNMKKYVEYLANVSKAEQRITLELSSSPLCFDNDELRRIVEEYHSVAAKGNENIAQLSTTCLQCFQEPLKKFISMFAAIEAAFQNRELLAQDWRNLSLKVRKLEEKERTGANFVKLERERKALVAAGNELVSCHSSLLSELRYFLDKRPEFFHPILETFMRSQLDYHGNMTRLFTLLSRIPIPQVDTSPSSASIPEGLYQEQMTAKLSKLHSLSIVKKI